MVGFKFSKLKRLKIGRIYSYRLKKKNHHEMVERKMRKSVNSKENGD